MQGSKTKWERKEARRKMAVKTVHVNSMWKLIFAMTVVLCHRSNNLNPKVCQTMLICEYIKLAQPENGQSIHVIGVWVKLHAFSAFYAVCLASGRPSGQKNWVIRCWRGYLSRARCKWFAHGRWTSLCHCHPIILCFIKIQTGLTFLVPAYPGCPRKDAIKQVSGVLNCATDPNFMTFTLYISVCIWTSSTTCDYIRAFVIKTNNDNFY